MGLGRSSADSLTSSVSSDSGLDSCFSREFCVFDVFDVFDMATSNTEWPPGRWPNLSVSAAQRREPAPRGAERP
ncbi:hypothetical protein, partial [Streptomyces caniscabiei]|uniref:hypothetical protein n=1 Tax=Streptomyces caniscabiei TaxID=2746961 RepID=UPI001F26F6F0